MGVPWIHTTLMRRLTMATETTPTSESTEDEATSPFFGAIPLRD